MTTTPGGQPPVVGWAAPSEPVGLGLTEVARDGWRLTRSGLPTLVAITLVPLVTLELLLLPAMIATGRLYERMITFWTTLDITRYGTDPEGIQRELRAVMQTTSESTAISAVTTGLSVVIVFIVLGALAAATLDLVAGRRPTFRSAYGAVGRHARDLVLPAVIIGIAYMALILPTVLNQDALLGGGDVGRRAALSFGFGMVALVVEILVIYLAVRWSLAFQAMVGEDLGFRRSLSRSADLTAGARIRIFLIGLTWSIVIGLLVGAIAGFAALLAGLLTGSVVVGLTAMSVAISICGLVYLPFMAAVLTVIYRTRVGDATDVATGRAGEGGGAV